MQDEYTGEAGTYVTDPRTGKRMPIEEWQALQDKLKSERVNYLDTQETKADFEQPAVEAVPLQEAAARTRTPKP